MKNKKTFSIGNAIFTSSFLHNLIKACFAIAVVFIMQGCSRSSYKIAITSVLEQDRKANDGITSVAEYVANQNKNCLGFYFEVTTVVAVVTQTTISFFKFI